MKADVASILPLRVKTEPSAHQEVKPPRWRRWSLALLRLVTWTALLGGNAWAVAALYFDVRIAWLRLPLAVLFAGVVLGIYYAARRRGLAKAMCAGCFALVLGWWLLLEPSNTRAWQPDVAVLPSAEFTGSKVSIRNIRHCDYRTETNFTVRHYDQTYDLDKLRTADLSVVHWGSPLIAHTMVSFGFEGGDYLCISIEVRKEEGESYSAVRGFFRQFELTYIIADERDLIRLRTNFRQGEEVYLYRLRMEPERLRAILEEYLRRATSLREQPEWYHALTSNCTTGIRHITDQARGLQSRWDWRILANGRSDEMLFERGAFASELPFAELKERCHINARARAAGSALDFSRLIRQDLPGTNP